MNAVNARSLVRPRVKNLYQSNPIKRQDVTQISTCTIYNRPFFHTLKLKTTFPVLINRIRSIKTNFALSKKI